jgi:hypothetical protein
MNKTNPIGVRFRTDLLEKIKTEHGIESPQKALVFYERFFAQHHLLAREVKSPLRDISTVDQKNNQGLAVPAKPKTPKDILNGDVTTVTLKGNKPKNLDELKALCPFPEKSDERSEWIRTERPKYGI